MVSTSIDVIMIRRLVHLTHQLLPSDPDFSAQGNSVVPLKYLLSVQ